MALRAKRLTAQQAGALWADFYAAHGPEVMQRAYGWSSANARQIRPGEKVWAFHDPGVGATRGDGPLIGWGVCALALNDPDDDEAVFAIGVFPSFERRGYRHRILDWLCDWSQRHGAKYAKIIVFADNEENYNRTLAECYEQPECPWVHAGDVWYPAPGYAVFVRDLSPEREEAKEAA